VRLFRRFDHEGPYRYLLRLKMNFAAERLRDPKVLVKEAAAVGRVSRPVSVLPHVQEHLRLIAGRFPALREQQQSARRQSRLTRCLGRVGLVTYSPAVLEVVESQPAGPSRAVLAANADEGAREVGQGRRSGLVGHDARVEDLRQRPPRLAGQPVREISRS
jgi:hypothetical protein